MVKGAKQMQPLPKFEITLDLGAFYIWEQEEEIPYHSSYTRNLTQVDWDICKEGG